MNCFFCKKDLTKFNSYNTDPICCDKNMCDHICCFYCDNTIVIPKRMELNGLQLMAENYRNWALNQFHQKKHFR